MKKIRIPLVQGKKRHTTKLDTKGSYKACEFLDSLVVIPMHYKC